MDNPEKLQRLILILTWANLPIVALASFSNDMPIMTLVAASAAFAVLGEIGLRLHSSLSSMLVGLALMGQPAVITAAMAGHSWQTDTHMYFFAVLAALSLLSSIRVLVVATSFIILHHLSLNFLLPELVYSGGSDVSRTFLHAVIVGFETAILSVIVRNKNTREAQLRAAERHSAKEAETAQQAQEELERTRNQSVDAQNAMITELQNWLGSVVDRAKDGDFSGRVSHRFENDGLNTLSEQINSLMQNTEAGFSEIRKVMVRLADGDMTQPMTGEFSGAFEEIQHNINSSVEQLSQMIGSTAVTAREISSSADIFSRNATQLSNQSSEQAASLEQTAATVEEISKGIDSNASNAADAEKQSTEAASRAHQGTEIVNNAIQAMEKIEESAQKITDIISVIESISFQTNLLALNAAVEAARAGESGKGFAVVASEVRTLAQRSADAANDISELIESSTSLVSEGVTLVRRSGASMQETSQSIESVKSMVNDISEASQAQARGISEIASVINQLDRMTQDNARASSETACGTQTLLEQVQKLEQGLQAFNVSPKRDASDSSFAA